MTARAMTMSDVDQGELFRDEGMKRSSERAELIHDGWNEKAFHLLRRFPNAEFMAEDVRAYAEDKGLPKPPSARAWGAVIVRAKKEGIIRAIGFRSVKNPKAHRTPATLWRKTA